MLEWQRVEFALSGSIALIAISFLMSDISAAFGLGRR